MATESADISLQSADSHISLSLGKQYLSAAASNFATNPSDIDEWTEEPDIDNSSSLRSSLYMK